MDSFKVTVTGARQAGVTLDAFPDGLHDELLAEVGALGAELEGLVEAATPHRTGKLRSEERLKVFNDPNRIKAEVVVTAEQAKAGALEYGAHRLTKVSAHPMRLDHAWGDKLAAPELVMVAAYTRTPDIEEHAFLRGPLAQFAPQALGRLNAVVEKAVAAANA